MKNIDGAIIAEEQYIKDKTSGSERSMSIYDYIKPYGYDDLYDFRRDKIIHQVRNLNMDSIEIDGNQVQSEGDMIFINYFNRKPCILWNIRLNEDIVFLPVSCNKEYEGFRIIKPGYDCDYDRGNIMTFDGDLDLVVILPKQFYNFFMYLNEEIAEYLKTFTDNVEIDKNDILVNGYKVSGLATTEYDDSFISLYHISFADKSDLVREYFKDSIKVPGHIDFTTSENLLEHIFIWLQLH